MGIPQLLYQGSYCTSYYINPSIKSEVTLSYNRIRKNHLKKNKIAVSIPRETQKHLDRDYAKRKYSKIFGTPEHDKRKEKMKVVARKRCILFQVEQGGGNALLNCETFE